jgi:membrane protein
MGIVQTVDRVQKRGRMAAVTVATFKKFNEDRSTNLAAMVAFWGFFSIFPLFLVLITLLAWFLPAADKNDVLGHVAKMLPLLDPSTLGGLTGAWWAFAIGLVSALWSGTGVVRSLQFAFDSVAEVPYHQRPGLVKQTLRSLWVLATIGVGLVITTLLSGLISSSASGVHLGVLGHIAGYVIAALLDVGIFVAAFRILSEHSGGTRDVLPGALLSGIGFFVLQELSALIISHYLQNAGSTYGHFATVITILWWFYLQANLTLLGAQLNVVLKEHLFPRSLTDAPQTDADHRALQAYAAERTYVPEQVVETRVKR